MIGLEINRNALSDKGWAFYGEELKYTSNRELIADEIKRIYKQRVWLEIRHPGYKSANTLILSLNKGEIELELPPDWPGKHDTVLLQYRIPGEPWHSLRVRVNRVAGGSIFFSFPDLFTITEKRQYFRVEVPTGSEAKIMLKKRSASKTTRRRRSKFLTATIRDISAGGMAVHPLPMPGVIMPGAHTMVGPVELNLKIDAKKVWPVMEIEKAEVIRVAETMSGDRTVPVMGIKFHLSRKEEENLFNYIRHRELAIMKSGVE